jgi:hypothetical protein
MPLEIDPDVMILTKKSIKKDWSGWAQLKGENL